MPRTADAGMITYLDGNRNYRLCKCFRIIRRDGTVFAFTDHDKPLDIDLSDGKGETTYPADSVIEVSEIESKTNVGASNMEVSMVLLEAGSMSVEDILLGLFDDAVIDVFEARWDVTPPTILRGFCGLLSSAEIMDNFIQVQYRSLIGLYDQSVLRIIRRGCAYELGKDDEGFHRCPVELEAPGWTALTAYTKREDFDAKTEIGAIIKPITKTRAVSVGSSLVQARSPYSGAGTGAATGTAEVRGISDQPVEAKVWFKATNAGISGLVEPAWPATVGDTIVDGSITWEAFQARSWSDGIVTGVTNNREFADTSNDFPDNYWAFGYLTWISGLNSGKRIEVTYSKVNGDVKLFERMKQDIQAGDTYDIVAGCDHFQDTCSAKFDNVWWFGGFNDAPGAIDVMQTPQAH